MTKKRIAINGLGRIGKNVLRRYFENPEQYPNIQVSAVNFGKNNFDSKIHLLRHDSVHGHFSGVKEVYEDHLIINNSRIKLFKENDITNINWDSDIVLECTGRFNNKDDAKKHIDANTTKIIVSAPCTNADKTIVFGVNHQNINHDDIIISAGSCTTNCLAPVAKVIDDAIGIESGFMTTVHSYTNDQNIIDSSHKDLRRSRAAALSIIPTSTGAAKSIGLVLPQLSGKLDGVALRVPTPNVSMIDLSFIAKKDTSANEINEIFTKEIESYFGILAIEKSELVSIDFNHTTASAIFDLTQTKVVNGKLCRVVAWYDNEWAFSCRMLDIANYVAGL